MKQEIKKEVVLQMIWDRHFDLGMEKDLDDICEDIYNEVFVLLLGKARKETAREIAKTLISVLWEEEKDETIRIKDVHRVIRDVVGSQYGVEVE